MKQIPLCAGLVLAGLIFFGTTQASAQKKTDKDAVLLSPEDLKWEQMPGGPPGVMSAMVWGDQTKGAYAEFTKFPAGFKAPPHFHTNTTRMVVIKGGYTFNGKTYGPGSYVTVPGGMVHASGGVAESETIFFIEQSGKFDFNVAETPKAKN